jgi:two-component system NtrC family sensor kinase
MHPDAGTPTLSFGVLEASPDATLVVDREGGIHFANARAAQMFGMRDVLLVGKQLDHLLVPACREWLRDVLADLFTTPATTGRDDRHDHAGAQDLRALRATAATFPIEMAFGRAPAVSAASAVVVVRDLTQARNAEDRRATEADKAQARMDALFEFAPAFILAISRDGKVEYINRIMPNYRRADVIGGSWLQYFPPDRQLVMQKALAAVFSTGLNETFETTTPGPDGSTRWFSTQIGPIREDGNVVGAVLVAQDITDQKRSQTELETGRHMALLGTMAAGVAHEINTPIQFVGDSIHFLRGVANDLLTLITSLQALRVQALTGTPVEQAIAGAAKAEEEADLPYIRENMPAAFQRCIDGLDRVATIVRSLKEFSHPPEKEMKPVDLNRGIESTLTIARGEYKYVAELETDLGDLPLVTCHAGEINQAVLNIVVNAAHAIGDVVRGTDNKGLITVRTRREGDTVVIAISDTGGGIPEAIRGRIFDPFFTTKEVGTGTGQGLAIAWAKVKEQHNGDLTFETEIGKGSTFLIRLPIAGKAATP